ncbi:imidazoleglycerol-phosphate synthase [Rhodotorula paludigena]|uniref:imidazoleglycerol-phosphate synthase n=1 Tax=Rhodotorula paludigena TaxID=86838 RepID=UPI00317412AF
MLYLLDYGAGNVTSLANSVRKLGFEFKWVQTPEDIDKADRILFPGVGAFGSAMAGLHKRGFVEPLKAYIASGRPYMGICIGMQCLFEESLESPEEKGLGIIPAKVGRFSSDDKKVPSMGWNGATPRRDIGDEGHEAYGFGDGNDSYYFVHSYRVDATQPGVEDWALTLSQYGQEKYVSAVQRGNVFGTQFHPEKSGKAGLAVVEAWLKATDTSKGGKGMLDTSVKPLRPMEDVNADLVRKGFTKRIVACLDVRANDQGDLVVTKGDQYDVREAEESATTADEGPSGAPEESSTTAPDAPVAETTLPTSTVSSDPSAPPPAKRQRQVRNLGKPVDLARRYYAEGADEVAFLNITSFRSCPLHDQPMLDVVRQSAETVFVPLTIGGGIRDTTDPDGTSRSALEVAGTYFRCGADKVSIGSDAVFAVEELLAADGKKSGKTSIETISYAYGAQAVVVSFDPKRVYAASLDDIPAAHRPSAVDLSGPLASSPSTELKPDLGPNGERYCWYQCTVRGGRETRDIDVVQLAQGVEKLGAGEILLNSVDKDGSKSGFDCRLVDLVRSSVGIPVVASSGAGRVEDFSEVFARTDVEAALAAGIFHRKEVPIEDVKKHLVDGGIKVRRV